MTARAAVTSSSAALSNAEAESAPCRKRVCETARAEAGEVAHDLDDQIGVVLANASVAREDAQQIPHLRALLGDMEFAAERCADLSRRLLLLSRRVAHPASAAGAPQLGNVSEGASNGLRRETVLLAESEPLVRRALWRALHGHGYRVLLAHDGDEAVSRYLRHRAEVALVVLDRSMSRQGGFQVLFTIRDSAPRMPAIVLSGSYDGAQCNAILNTAILGKPIDPGRLTNQIRQLIDCAVD